MNQEQAFKVLVQAVEIAQGRGVYKLEESATILEAIKTFVQGSKPTEPEDKVSEEVTIKED